MQLTNKKGNININIKIKEENFYPKITVNTIEIMQLNLIE